MHRGLRPALVATALSVVAVLAGLAPAAHAQAPRHGGELSFVVGSEMPSYDGHREETFGLIHPIAPHYSTLLRTDPVDPTGTKLVGDLAESWMISGDGLTYTFKVRRGVKFHDGSTLTARDVKASYDKIANPPAGVSSPRKGQYTVIEAIEATDAQTLIFRLKHPSAGFLASLASPWNLRTNDRDLSRVVPTLVVNLKTAKALGVTISPAVPARADRVIE